MKTITKIYTIYDFDELDKKIQDDLISFYNFLRLRVSVCHNIKDIEKIVKTVIKDLKKLKYFKNGDIAYIPGRYSLYSRRRIKNAIYF